MTYSAISGRSTMDIYFQRLQSTVGELLDRAQGYLERAAYETLNPRKREPKHRLELAEEEEL